MQTCNLYEILIQGITQKNNRHFRPSDWAERLCGILSSFDQGHRLSYHKWVRPISIDNIRYVAIDKKLQQISPVAFNFLMNFARDNDLRILDCQALLEEQEQSQTQLKNLIKQKNALPKSTVTDQTATNTATNNFMTPEESNAAFSALQHLHTNISSI